MHAEIFFETRHQNIFVKQVLECFVIIAIFCSVHSISLEVAAIQFDEIVRREIRMSMNVFFNNILTDVTKLQTGASVNEKFDSPVFCQGQTSKHHCPMIVQTTGPTDHHVQIMIL